MVGCVLSRSSFTNASLQRFDLTSITSSKRFLPFRLFELECVTSLFSCHAGYYPVFCPRYHDAPKLGTSTATLSYDGRPVHCDFRLLIYSARFVLMWGYPPPAKCLFDTAQRGPDDRYICRGGHGFGYDSDIVLPVNPLHF